MFIDMAVLVAAQGEMVDSIAVHVNDAVKDTEEGVQALQKAVVYQKKSRKVKPIHLENVSYYRHIGCHYRGCNSSSFRIE